MSKYGKCECCGEDLQAYEMGLIDCGHYACNSCTYGDRYDSDKYACVKCREKQFELFEEKQEDNGGELE